MLVILKLLKLDIPLNFECAMGVVKGRGEIAIDTEA
jgi:hypothetical protein